MSSLKIYFKSLITIADCELASFLRSKKKNPKEVYHAYIEAELEIIRAIKSNNVAQVELIIDGIQALDRLIIFVGPDKQYIEQVRQFETSFMLEIRGRNRTKWPAPSDISAPSSLVGKSCFFETLTSLVDPSMESFLLKKNEPLYLDFAMSDDAYMWKSSTFWAHNFGHRLVPVEVGAHYLLPSWHQKIVEMGEFIEIFSDSKISFPKDKLYLAQHDIFSQIPGLEEMISTPCLLRDLDPEKDVIKSLWFGPAKVITPFHFDPYDNIFRQINGEKTLLFLNKDIDSLFIADLNRQIFSSPAPSYSQIIDTLSKNRLAVKEITLGCNECLYIPKNWWHLVYSRTASLSVSFWFNSY